MDYYVCPMCESIVTNAQKCCSLCGCPINFIKEYSTKRANTTAIQEAGQSEECNSFLDCAMAHSNDVCEAESESDSGHIDSAECESFTEDENFFEQLDPSEYEEPECNEADLYCWMEGWREDRRCELLESQSILEDADESALREAADAERYWQYLRKISRNKHKMDEIESL